MSDSNPFLGLSAGAGAGAPPPPDKTPVAKSKKRMSDGTKSDGILMSDGGTRNDDDDGDCHDDSI